MKSRKLWLTMLFFVFICASMGYAAEDDKTIGYPIQFEAEPSEGLKVEKVTAVIIKEDIEFRVYFTDGVLSFYSFFNPPDGAKVMIYGKPPEGTNENGVLIIKYPLEEFKKFGSIAIKMINDYSVQNWVSFKPKQIQYDKIPRVCEFNDENLMKAIKRELKTDIIYSNQLKQVTWLNGNNKNISDLSGLEQLTELIHLDLGNNKIDDISQVKHLTKLEYVNLENNHISDISNLEKLTSLGYLNLKGNKINDIKSLEQLLNIKKLFLGNNPITNFSVLKDTYNSLESNDFNEQMIEVLMKEGFFKDINCIKDNETNVINHTINKFTDISVGKWYAKSVAYLVAMEVIDGYADNTFKPDGTITIDQFIKLVISSLGYNVEKGTVYWAQPYIDKAIELKIINEGEFINYRRQITRGEIAVIIARIIGNADKPEALEKYQEKITDFDSIPDKYKEHILLVYSKGIISGYPDKTYRYNETATRAVAASILVRLIDQTARVTN